MVEHDLAKVGAASSSLVSRSEKEVVSSGENNLFLFAVCLPDLSAAGKLNRFSRPHE